MGVLQGVMPERRRTDDHDVPMMQVGGRTEHSATREAPALAEFGEDFGTTTVFRLVQSRQPLDQARASCICSSAARPTGPYGLAKLSAIS